MLGIKKLLAFLRRQVGLRTDAASATGSLHAKIKNINDNTIPNTVRQKPRGPAGAYGSLTSGTVAWVTALNVPGKGRLVLLGRNQTNALKSRVRVTVDGFVLATSGVSYDGPAGDSFPPHDYYLASPRMVAIAEGVSARNAEINFKTSLRLEIYSDLGSTTLNWLYEIE